MRQLSCSVVARGNLIVKKMIGKTVTLSNGMKMPAFGFGTYENKDNKEGIRDAVKIAIDVGYRLFDTSPIYLTEGFVGEAIRDKIAEGVVKREDLFVVSKLWNTKHKFENVMPACKQSVQDLGLDYVDLYLIHWPFDYSEESNKFWDEYNADIRELGEVDYTETWRGMEECVKLGLTKSIGLSNFNVNQIFRINEHATIKPVVCQDECHVMLSQRRLRIFCRVNEIAVMGYSPLGNPGYLNSLTTSKKKSVYDNSVVEEIAKKYGKSKAQVALRFLVDNDIIPIPKASSIEHIRENIDIDDFELTPEENKSLHDLDCEYRIRPCYAFESHPRYPFHGGYWN